MRIFTRVVDRRSFTLAAEDTGVPRSTVTDAVKKLENRLGVKLLNRTTRTVSPTLDGDAYYERCLSILTDIEEAEGAFAGAKPKGVLRVDVHGTLARHFVLPKLTQFLATYPDIEFYMSEGDRLVDLVREGIDCVLRVGSLKDSDMVARQLTALSEVTVASPSYLKTHGVPINFKDLDRHSMVGFRTTGSSAPIPLEFMVEGKLINFSLRSSITVNSAETFVNSAILGLGIIQVPLYHVEREISAGNLIVLFPEFPPSPTPVSLLYPRDRQLSPRVRVFLDWMKMIFSTDNASDLRIK